MAGLFIGTSWKMNLTSKEASRWFDTWLPLVRDVRDRQLFVLPPFPAIWLARDRLAGSGIAWGAQDVHPEDCGAHTGDVSAPMLADLGCTYVEVGHSERRRDHGETPDLIARKVEATLRAGMRPILCTGEPMPAPPDDVIAALRLDLQACLAQTRGRPATDALVAYEPHWAIGAGASAAEPGYVARVVAGLRVVLAELSGDGQMPVLYGGSVDELTAPALLGTGVDGLFVGRLALDPVAFAAIAHVQAALPDARDPSAHATPRS